MMITIVIYTAYPKLLNHYTRLMRQYAVAMMLAFLFLAMNQLESWKTKDHGICIFFGKFISRNSNSTEILPIRIIKIFWSTMISVNVLRAGCIAWIFRNQKTLFLWENFTPDLQPYPSVTLRIGLNSLFLIFCIFRYRLCYSILHSCILCFNEFYEFWIMDEFKVRKKKSIVQGTRLYPTPL